MITKNFNYGLVDTSAALCKLNDLSLSLLDKLLAERKNWRFAEEGICDAIEKSTNQSFLIDVIKNSSNSSFRFYALKNLRVYKNRYIVLFLQKKLLCKIYDVKNVAAAVA